MMSWLLVALRRVIILNARDLFLVRGRCLVVYAKFSEFVFQIQNVHHSRFIRIVKMLTANS